MRTKNAYFLNKKKFNDFVNENSFANEESLLIQVFSSILEKDRLNQVLSDILNTLPQAMIIGATTDGEILDNIVTTDKIIISISSFEHASLSVSSLEHSGDSFTCGINLAKKLLQENTKVLFLFTDGLNTNGEIFLNGIKSVSGDVAIAGGLAGDGANFTSTYVFSNDGIISSGAVGISVNADKLNISTTYSFNWQEIGKILKITKAKDNRVYEIDSISAVDVYQKYLGANIANSLPAVGMEFPLIINRNGMKIARAVLGKESDGSLVFAGNLHEGDEVQFGYGNAGMILSEALNVKEQIDMPCVESIFVYSCMARRRFLDEAIAIELTPLAHLAPTVGFFTYGEFFKQENCELLNQTMTVLSMSETDTQSTYKFQDKSPQNEIVESSTTHRALSHLIKETSHELEETNANLEKIVEQKTQALCQKIKELERVSAVKSEFLAGMSHEIRTPLNAMLGFVDILKASEENKEKLKRFSIIKNSGTTLLRIINDILDFSKIESAKMLLERRKFLTKEPFADVSKLFNEKAKEEGIKLKISYSRELPKYFVGDIVRIKQVVANFLNNAIKFTPQGGKINLVLNFDTLKKELKLSVHDTGVGIDKKNLQKIFEAFTQEDSSTTRKFGGTGLGLSISKALIKSMEGYITVTSVLGEGSTFSFILPTLKSNTPETKSAISLAKIDLDKSLQGQILLVEDNKTNQLLMNILLGNIDLDVDMAENGIEAVEMFKKKKYDLILMDENMPKMNGIEATKIILQLEKENGVKHTPIVALTANALATDRARFLNAGMDEFITKPIEHELFIRILHSFLL